MINSPFEILTYDESMDKYGTDKPDLRFEMPLFDLSKIAQNIESNVIQNSLKQGGIFKGLLVKDWSNLGRKDFDRLTELVKSQGAGGLIYISISKDTNINMIKLEDTNGPLNKFFTLDNIKDMQTKISTIDSNMNKFHGDIINNFTCFRHVKN